MPFFELRNLHDEKDESNEIKIKEMSIVRDRNDSHPASAQRDDMTTERRKRND